MLCISLFMYFSVIIFKKRSSIYRSRFHLIQTEDAVVVVIVIIISLAEDRIDLIKRWK